MSWLKQLFSNRRSTTSSSTRSSGSEHSTGTNNNSSKPSLDSDDTKEIQPPSPNHYFEYEYDAVALLEHWQKFHSDQSVESLQQFIAEYRRQEELLGTKEEFQAQRQLIGLSLPYLEPRLVAALEQGTLQHDVHTSTWVALVEILSRASYNIAVLSSESCRRLIGQLLSYFRALIAELRGDAKDGNRTSLLGSHRSREDLAVNEPIPELDVASLYRSLNGLQALVTTFSQLSSPGDAWRHQYQIEALKLQLNVRGMSALIELNKQTLLSNDVITLLVDLLRVIHGLTAEQLNGSRVTYELTMSALNMIGGLVHECHSAQPFLDKCPALFELLADHLGWPSDVCPQWPLTADAQVTPVISTHDLFMLELLTIQVFTELSILSSTNMRRWRTTGGFQRVIDWVLWTAVTFQKQLSEPAPASIWQVASFTPYLSRLTLGKHVTSQGMTRVTSDDEISPRDTTANNSPLTPTPPRPWHICNVPLAMIFQVLYCLCVGGLQANYSHQTNTANSPNLNLQVLNILMDLFNNDIRQTPQNIVAREWLSDTCPECQLLVLDFVSRLAVDFPAVKPQLLACNLWATLSSQYFFAPLLWHVTDATARGLNIEHPLVKNITGTYLFLEHRRYLFQLIEFLATLGDSCHFECATLLTLWQQCYVQLYKSYSAVLTAQQTALSQALDSSDHHVTSRKLSLQPFFNTTLVLESRDHKPDLAAYLEAYYWLSHLLSRLLAQSRGELTRQILLHSIQLNIGTGQVLVTSSTAVPEPSVKHVRLTLALLCNTGLLLTGVNACQTEVSEHERQDRHVTRQHVLDLIGAVLGMTSTSSPSVTLALVDDALLELMFGLLRETAMRRWSYNWLISALGTVPSSVEDKNQLLKLATKYLNYLCALKMELKDEEQLLLFLLQGLRMVAGGRNNKSQQDLLREAGAFVKLSNMLTGVKAVDRLRLDELSSHVIGCLTALMANNAENKEFFSKSIGVTQFQTLLLEAYDNRLTARVLNGLLLMMTDGQDLDDDAPSSLIQNSAIALLLFALTPNWAEEEQVTLYDHVIRLVSKHDINQSILANTNLIYQLLDLLPQITAGPVQERALSLVALLSKQGITVRELKKLFTLFKPVADRRSPLTPVLVQVLEAVARASADVISASSRDLENSTVALSNNSTTQFTASAGSSSFFEFNGRHSAVTVLSTCQWPLGLDDSDKPACSVALWLRATSWTDPSLAPLYLPRLCSLLKYDGGTGVEIYFRPSWDTSTAHLVVSLQPSRDQAPVLVEFTAHPLLEREWYHVTLTYMVTARKNTELHLYVNGRHVQHETVRAPYIFKGLDCVRIGSNAEVYRTASTIYRESSFYGQMANVYWFSDELTAPHVAAIYRLGPNYMANFQGDSAAEVAEQLDLSVNQAMQLLSELRALVHVAFMSQACVQLSPDVKLKSVPALIASAPLTPVNERAVSEADSLCYDCSPESLPRARRHAVLTGVSVITRSILHDIVNCLGGVSALLPLFQQLDLAEDSDHVTAPLYTFAADIVRVMAWLLVAPPRSDKSAANNSTADEWHRQHQIKFYHQGGFPIVSYLLLRSSPQNLTIELLDALQLFLKEYKQPNTRVGMLIEQLEDDLFLHLFFNFHLWIYAEYTVQKHLLTRVLPFYVSKIKRLRTVFGVQPFLDALRLYYWTARDSHSMAVEAVHHPVTGTCVGRRPDDHHVIDLQRDLVALIELTVQDGITIDETRALLQFMIDCKENGQLILVLKMMVRLLLAPNQTGTYLLNALLTLGGTDTLLLLLDNPNKSVQVLVLMLIDLIIENVKSTPARNVTEGQDSPALNRNQSGPLAIIATNSSKDSAVLTDSLARLPPIFPIKAITNTSTTSPVSTPTLTSSDSAVALTAEKSPMQVSTPVMKSRSRRLFRQKSASRVKISQMMARAVSLSEDMSPLTAILTHHLTGHVDQPNNTNVANNSSEESRDDSSEGDLARSASSTRHELYNILFAMLVGKWHETSSVIVTGVNDDLAEPHVGKIFVDDKVSLTHFPVLEVLFGLVQSHASTTHLLLQDLALLLQRHDNCHAFKRLNGWHVHLLSLLFDADSVTFDIVCQIYKWLLLDALQHDKDGWTLLYETEAYCTHFNDKGVDAPRFMNQLIRSVVAELCKESWNYNKTTKDTSRMSVLRGLHERDSALKNNLMLFILFVEEYLYYRLDGSEPEDHNDRSSDHVIDEDEEEQQRNNSLDEDKFHHYHMTMIIRARDRDGHEYDEEYSTARDVSRGRSWRDAEIAMNLVDLVMNLNLAKIIQISVPQPNSSGALKRTMVRVREGGLRQLVLRLVSACLYEHSESDSGDHARSVRDFLVRTIPQLHALVRKKASNEEVHYIALHLLRALKLRHLAATWQEISDTSPSSGGTSAASQLISDTIKETKESAVLSKSALVRDHGDVLVMIHWLQDLLVNHLKSPLTASFKKDNLPHEQQRKVKDVVAQLTQGYHANGPLNLQPGADSGHVFKISSSTYQSPLLSPTFIATMLTLIQGSTSATPLTYLEAYLASRAAPLTTHEIDMAQSILKTRVKWLSVSQRQIEEYLARQNLNIMETTRRIEHVKTTVFSESQFEQRIHELKISLKDAYARIANQWKRILRSLNNERGPWCPQQPSRVYWKLDKTENSLRMRLKLKRNYNFNDHRDAVQHKESRDASAINSKGIDEYERLRLLKLPVRRDFMERYEEEEMPDDQIVVADSNTNLGASSEIQLITRKSSSAAQQTPAPAPAPSYRIVMRVGAEWITPSNVYQGQLALVLVSADNSCHVTFTEELTENAPNTARARKMKHWAVHDIRGMHMRRYLLRRSAVELFMNDQTNNLFNLSKKDCQRLYQKIIGLKPLSLLSITEMKLTPDQILLASGLCDKWRHRHISNFEYLMHLNTIAGRTYNDLTQYPVFPWVLQDYTSHVLDLDNPRVYRDLSKPIGAINNERLKYFQDRYEQWESMQDQGSVPPFHYGSHYSSAGVVLYYLIRVEPFTTLHIQLQGGKFDHTDRLFHSIEQTWHSCTHDTSDVKELIPEFFYFPEFLTNHNSFDFGTKQNGIKMNDVLLPPWANNSPELFIRLHRRALESEYVSLHLHKWIDLVFGYLQRGHPAREANNVFYYLTYEGAVDLDEITDPVLKVSTRDQIAHFGQTPSQLLKAEPHVARFPLTTDLSNHYRSIFVRPDMLDIYRINLDPVTPSGTNASTTTEPSGAIVYMSCAMMNDRVIAVDEYGLIRIYRLIRPLTWQHVESNHPFKYLPNYRQRLDHHATDGDQSMTLDTSRHGQHLTTRHSTHQFAISPDGRTLYSAAHWDGTAKVVAIDSHSLSSAAGGSSSQTALSLSPVGLVHSKPPLTCLALAEDGGLLVTGCADTTLTVWTVHGPGLTAANPASNNVISPQRNTAKSPLLPVTLHPRHVLYGHDREITAVAISRDLDVCISGSRDGTCLVHTLKQGQYVRALQLPHANASIDMIAICATTGHFIMYSKSSLTLYLYTINGKLLAQTDANDHLNHMVVTKDGEYLISGGRKGTVVIRTLFTLQTVHKFQVDAAVCSLALTAEEKHLLVGLDNGKMILFYPRGL